MFGALLGIGGALAGKLFGGGGDKPKRSVLDAEFDAARADARSTGRDLERTYIDRAKSFDPSKALDDYARGAFGQVSQNISDQLRDLTGRAVGSGRLNTGFFDEDQGEVVNRNLSDFNNQLLSHALDAESMGLQNLQSLGSYAANKQNTYYDLLSGGMDRETAEENARRQREASLFGGLAQLAGTYIGSRGKS